MKKKPKYESGKNKGMKTSSILFKETNKKEKGGQNDKNKTNQSAS